MKRTPALILAVILLLLFCAVVLPFANPSPDNAASLSLVNREVLTGLNGARGSTVLYRIAVPEGASNLQFSVFGGSGKPVDVYAKFGAPPVVGARDAIRITPGEPGMISIPAPYAGTYYVLVRAARGAYRGVSLVGSYALRGDAFRIGMHAHRLYNGGDDMGPPSIEPAFSYGVIRDWDISGLQDAVIWKKDGSIDFSLLDKVYAGHGKRGAKVLKTFGSVPTWAAKRPGEPNPKYPAWPGSLSGPRDLDAYEDYVFRFVSHTKQMLWAVEGWNEPYACPQDEHGEFTTMTPTELADVQKRLYRAAKRVDSDMLVFSPAQAYLCGIPTLLGARTSQGEPISQFFDVFAWHAYNRSARGNAGPAYVAEIHKVRQYLAQAGLADMPIADTEHGWLSAPKEGGAQFRALSEAEKGQVLYDTAQVAKSMGLLAIVWYSYDDRYIGMPMTSPLLSQYLQRMYSDFNTAHAISPKGAHARRGTSKMMLAALRGPAPESFHQHLPRSRESRQRQPFSGFPPRPG